MLLNQNRKLWFCENPSFGQPVWLPLAAGISECKMYQKNEKILFYELGNEEVPRESFVSGVKCITLRGHIDETDEALRKILKMNGFHVGILQGDFEDNRYNNAIYCESYVSVTDNGSGIANEPQGFEIQLSCGHEKHGKITNGVNGIHFTEG